MALICLAMAAESALAIDIQVKAQNQTSMVDVTYLFNGAATTVAGTDVTTAVTIPGITSGVPQVLHTTFGNLVFESDAAGNLTQTGGPAIFSIVGSTITIENTISYPTLTVKTVNPTTMADARFFLYAGEHGRAGSHHIGDDQTIPGTAVTAGVTFPFTGMAPGQVYLLSTTFGVLGFTLDTAGNVVQTSGPSVFVFTGAPLGSTIT
ncbi:MAG: hypothetical protein ACYTJ0_19515, partial [Planctomycetota bacterium]